MKHNKKHILLMDNEISNKHLLANIFYISKTEKETNGPVIDDGRAENRTCPDIFNHHGDQSPAK